MSDTISKLQIAALLAAMVLWAAGCDTHGDADNGRPLQIVAAGIAAKSGENDAGTDQSVEDSQLTTLVREAIAADRQLQSQDIDVETEDGAVKLTGVVDSTSLRERAVELAGRIDGVAEVTDKLEVRN